MVTFLGWRRRCHADYEVYIHDRIPRVNTPYSLASPAARPVEGKPNPPPSLISTFSMLLRLRFFVGCRGLGLARNRVVGCQALSQAQAMYSSGSVQHSGFQDFFDVKAKPDDIVTTGRAWTVPDLRRKSFDDLHKLWFVLYKERNLLLSEREKTRRNQRPVLKPEENRYTKVKRSMAGIKIVLNERKRIEGMIEKEGNEAVKVIKNE